MFRKITIEVTGGESRDLVVRLMRAVGEAVRMIFEGDTGVSHLGALQMDQCEITLDDFDPCTMLEDSLCNPPSETAKAVDTFNPENIPDRKRENGY